MKVLYTLLACSLIVPLIAQPNLSISTFKTGFSFPVDIANAGDGSDRLFIVEKAGVIKIIDKTGTTLNRPFLDIDPIVNSTANERGLLGLVFHPDFVSNDYFYVNYTSVSRTGIANGASVISRFKVSATDPDSADVASEDILLVIPQPASNHNAGDLAFGPNGYLYIPMGDGGGATCLPQVGSSYLGKVLRLDVNQNMDTSPYYGIPPDNPYMDDGSVLDEIWSWGLRNPWRFSFDRLTGDMWIADVGQSTLEEVNYIPASSTGEENFGWSIMEGDSCYNSFTCNLINPQRCYSNLYTYPIFQYGRFSSNGGTSISGGYVYRGCEFPDMQGYYIVADYNSDNMWALLPDGTFTLYQDAGSNIVSFGEDEYGELYAADISFGTIYQVIDDSPTACAGCPINRAPENISSDSTVQAANTVYGLGLINGSSTVSFQGDNIQLNPGFEVMLNSIFNAEAGDPCNN